MEKHGEDPSYGIILLAAGASRRLGRPKQLLHYQGASLLNNAFRAAQQAGTAAVVVVVGAGAEMLTEELKVLGAEYVLNRQFGEGIASSIRCGLGYLMEFHRKVDHVIIMACDQPYVDGTHILALINKHKAAGTKIVASFYSNRKGIPALFHRTVFPELLALTGDRGAKGIIEKHESTAVVPFPAGAIDIDTEEAYKALNNDQG